MKKTKLHIIAAYNAEISKVKNWQKSSARNTAKNALNLWSGFEMEKTCYFVGSGFCQNKQENTINKCFTNLILSIMEKAEKKAIQEIAVENGKENAVNWVVPRATIAESLERSLKSFIQDLADYLEIQVTDDLTAINWIDVFNTTNKADKEVKVNSILLDSCNSWLIDYYKNADAKRVEKQKATTKANRQAKKLEKMENDAFALLANKFGISIDDAKARFIEIKK